jgi:DNA invertase Pin-like site-specific DNA recombinase
LVVAKLDRLSRNVAFLAALMDSGVEFVCCDNPHATRFTLHILAAVAEHEREMISTRTKAALQAAKVRGVKLGGCRGGAPKVNGELGVEANQQRANERAVMLAPVFAELRDRGLSLRAMASELNKRSIQTPRGAPWSAVTVRDVLARLPA